MIKELLLASALTSGVAITNLSATAPEQATEQPTAAVETKENSDLFYNGTFIFNDIIELEKGVQLQFRTDIEGENISGSMEMYCEETQKNENLFGLMISNESNSRKSIFAIYDTPSGYESDIYSFQTNKWQNEKCKKLIFNNLDYSKLNPEYQNVFKGQYQKLLTLGHFEEPAKPSLIEEIFKPITTTATAAMTLISGLLVSVVDIVYSGGKLTPMGLITLIPVGIGLVLFSINLIIKLINKIKVGKKG